ncbi:hypothetical protein LJC56_01465 [Christensenellaceae bacterium OttesenSCG-928-K19]|nr:hypothetical protein [Christensenellaceae bacterium OttesenSCG-928-K19]
MKGQQIIKTNQTLSLDDIQELMKREWSEQQIAQYRRYDYRSQQYIMRALRTSAIRINRAMIPSTTSCKYWCLTNNMSTRFDFQ